MANVHIRNSMRGGTHVPFPYRLNGSARLTHQCNHIYQLNAYSRYKKCIKCKHIKKDI